MSKQMKSPAVWAPMVALLLFQCACTTTTGIADFAAQSGKALSDGSIVLSDINQSCLRRQAADLAMDDFRTSSDSLQKSCPGFSDNDKGLLAASAVLTEYFAALSQLASSGSATIGKDANDAAAAAAKFGHLSAAATTAIGELASLLTRIAMDRYQRRNLAADLRRADPSVAAVCEELAGIVQTNYIEKMLPEEQQALTRRYESFAEDADPSPVLTILLQDRWSADLNRLAARRSAAQSYMAALKKVSGGHASLAAHTSGKSIKDLSGLLRPYTDSLATLAAAMKKET